MLKIDTRPMTAWTSDGRQRVRFIPGTISGFSNGPTARAEKYLPALIKQSKKKKAAAIRIARARHMRGMGHTYMKIANTLGVSITTIFKDCM